MDVLDDDDGRTPGGARLEDPRDEREQPVPARGGRQRRDGLIGTRDAEDVEQQRHVVAEARAERRLHPRPGDLWIVELGDAAEVAAERDGGQQRDVPAVRDTGGRVDARALPAAVGGEPSDEAALADARVADDADGPAAPGPGASERRRQLAAPPGR